MNTIDPQSFPGRLIPYLDKLASELLAKKYYVRLRMVVDLLSSLSQGGWDQMEAEVQHMLIEQMQNDYHIRAWDDWNWDADGPLMKIREIISNQVKAMNRK